MEKTFDLEEQFNDFLGPASGDGEEMDTELRDQLKRAFYAGCGRTLLILNDHAVNMEEEQGVSVIDQLFRQVHSFFLNDFTDDYPEGGDSEENDLNDQSDK